MDVGIVFFFHGTTSFINGQKFGYNPPEGWRYENHGPDRANSLYHLEHSHGGCIAVPDNSKSSRHGTKY